MNPPPRRLTTAIIELPADLRFYYNRFNRNLRLRIDVDATRLWKDFSLRCLLLLGAEITAGAESVRTIGIYYRSRDIV